MKVPSIGATLYVGILTTTSVVHAQGDLVPRRADGDAPVGSVLAELERDDTDWESLGKALTLAIDQSASSEPWLDVQAILEKSDASLGYGQRTALAIASAWAASGSSEEAAADEELSSATTWLVKGDEEGLAAWPLSRWLLDPAADGARRSGLEHMVGLGRSHATSPLSRARYDAMLGQIAEHGGRRREAEKAYAGSLGAMENALGPKAIEVLALRAKRALNLARIGEPSQAAASLREVLAGRDEYAWDLRGRFPVGLDDLAQYHYTWGRIELAEQLLRRAIEDYAAILGRGALEIANVEQLLADAVAAHGDLEEARRLEALAGEILMAKVEPSDPRIAVSKYRIKRLEAALAVSEERLLEGADLFIAADTLAAGAGVLSEHRAAQLWQVGLVLLDAGKLDRAEQLFDRGLALFDETWGAVAGAYTAAMSEAADPLTEQEEFDKAEFLRRRVLEIQEKVHGPTSVDYGRALADLGGLMVDRGDPSTGTDLALQALKILERRRGLVDHETLSAMNVLALGYDGMGQWIQAESFYRQVVEIREQHFSDDLETLGTAQLNYGSILRKLQRFDEAELFLRRGVDTYRKEYPEGHPRIGEALMLLERVLDDLGRYAEAEAVSREALAIVEPALGQHSTVAWCYEYLGRALVHQDKLDEAREAFERAREILVAVEGERDPDVATMMSSLAMVAENGGNLDRSVELHHEVIALRQEILGARSYRLVDSYLSLARVLRKLGKTTEAVASAEEAVEIARYNHPPDDARIHEAFMGLAEARAADGDLDAASVIFDDLLQRIDPESDGGRRRIERLAKRYARALRDGGRKKRAKEIEREYLGSTTR